MRVDPCREQAHFEFPQALFARAIGVSDQRGYSYTSGNRVGERPLNLSLVKTEDHDLDALLGCSNALDQRQNTITRLHQ